MSSDFFDLQQTSGGGPPLSAILENDLAAISGSALTRYMATFEALRVLTDTSALPPPKRITNGAPRARVLKAEPIKSLIENLVNKNQLAQHLRFSESYINKLMNFGLPRIKAGRAVRFRISEVMAWLDRRNP
jgi:predicted DNA-binding transcriptional regulator AlpA